MRKKYGDKWNRLESSKLNAQWKAELDKHRELLNQAAKTDKGLKDRFNSQEASFIVLSGSLDALKKYISDNMGNSSSSPSATNGNSSKKKALKELCDEVEAMKKERSDLIKQLEETPLPESLSMFGCLVDVYFKCTDYVLGLGFLIKIYLHVCNCKVV